MATQLKHIDFTSTSALTPRPNIRVAFIAGEAATAVHDAMAKLPAETQGATLDELAAATAADAALIQSMTCSLIETAHDLLSPRMYTAFLRWGDASSHLSSSYDTEEEGASRIATTVHALETVGLTPAENIHDLLFTTFLSGIEATHASTFGPFDGSEVDVDDAGAQLLKGLGMDMPAFSPIPALINDLSKTAWRLSKSKLAFSVPIGAAITGAFSFARGEEVEDREASGNAVRGDSNPMTSIWQRAENRYRTAKAEADRYHADVLMPADEHLTAVKAKWPDGYNFEVDPSAKAEVDAADYRDIDRHSDTLWEQAYETRVALYLLPAPSQRALAFKLRLFHENSDRDLTRADEIVERLMSDARYLAFPAKVAGYQTTEWTAALDAYDAVRRALAVKGLDDDTIDALADRETAAANDVLALVSANVGQVTTKLRILSEVNAVITATDLAPIVAELNEFACVGAPPAKDWAIAKAFATRRREFEASVGIDMTETQEDAYFGRVDAAEMVLLDNRAVTIEGALAKLRVAFKHQVFTDWSDWAIADTTNPKFVDGLRLSGMYERMAWGAIEDLARIAGVNLAEQGA